MDDGELSPGDRAAIQELLLGRYIWAIDNADLEGIVSTFTDDGIVQDRSGKRWDDEFGGVRGFASQVVRWQGRQPGTRRDQHWVQNLFIESGENGSARVTSYWFGAASGEGEAASIQVLGTYVDLCVKDGGRWLIKEKLIENWTAPTSHRQVCDDGRHDRLRRSTDRIVTTHTGSLPRPATILEILRRTETGPASTPRGLDEHLGSAVEDIVRHQLESGIDIVNDGELSKPSYATYIKDRVNGFGGETAFQISVNGESRDFPEFDQRRASANATVASMPVCDGRRFSWKDFSAVERDIENLTAAATVTGAKHMFMTAASPGVITFFLGNQYYQSQDAYEEALVEVMRSEYEAITAAGIELQIDCPDLAGSRQSRFADSSLGDFRQMVARHVELLNEATRTIPPEMMRMHLCWGNYEGPHHLDVPLRDIVDIVLKARPQVLSLEGANPRHEHEWSVWRDVRLPDEKVLMVGVIDSTTNYIEHPDLVAERLIRYASVVGRERVIASSDCGFATFADSHTIDERIAWAKLKTLAEGAAIATAQLW